MSNIIIYTSNACGYCNMAKQLLESKNAKYSEVRIDLDENQRAAMMERSGRRTVPQIFIDDLHIGGFDELKELENAGKLDSLLNNEGK